MDQRVKDLIEKAKVTAESAATAAGRAANNASKKAGELVETTKLNMRIFDLNTDIDLLFKDIGRSVYLTHTGVEIDPEEINEKIESIDSKYAAVGELKEQITLRKTSVKCPNCGKECDKNDAFCSSCGTTL